MKTKTQHTPEPWKLERICGTSRTEFRVTAGENETWKVLIGNGSGYGINLADGTLIAVAPELLEALKYAEALLVSRGGRFELEEQRKHEFIKATIAKAEGK